MIIQELIDTLSKQNPNLKISFLVANSRSDYHVSARLEDIDFDEEDGKAFFILKKVS